MLTLSFPRLGGGQWGTARVAAARGPARDGGRAADMAGDRLRRILSVLSAGGEGWSSDRLCAVCPGILGITGAGVMFMSGDIPRGSLCATNEVSRLIEDLQYTLGEGPCVDAHQQGRVVDEPDLADPVAHRWPAFTPPVLRAGVRAMFGFPLRIGTVRLGALNLYRDQPGPLSGNQHADALVVAQVAARWVLEAQAGAVPGTVAEELEAGADFHFAVHNAAGIVSVQEGVSVAEALIRLRAFAFSSGRPLTDVAQDVISHKLRLG
ncbi:MAG TPA: GAF and ANTAR domain-containing protein [Streptosporangiaceae bacterium]|nr:GAF and ANTAR domain-containing protein [Streptosporangiaceae bacterium]